MISNEMISLFAWLPFNSEDVWRHQDGAHPWRKAIDNNEAISAFIARKAEINTILNWFAALSTAHFNRAPDAVTWGDVGTLSSYLQRLRDMSDAAFDEGEYAV